MSARDIATELERHIEKLGPPPHGDTPDVMLAAAAEIRKLRARLAAREERAMCPMAEADDLRAEVEKWRTTVGAVMPADLKCWHQNSSAELPEVAAHTITNLRRDRDWWGDTAAKAMSERDVLARELARYRPAGWLMTRPDCDGSADWWEPGDAEPSPDGEFVAVRLYRDDEVRQ